MTNPIPQGYTALTGYLIVDDVKEAIDFYRKALDAQENVALKAKDGSIMHAELTIGDARLMLGAACEQWQAKSAKTLGGSPISFVYYTSDVDAAFAKAKQCGMQEKMPVTEQFWGDRMGALLDPFGIKWSIAQHVRDVSEKEMQDAMQKMSEGSKAA